MIPDSSQSHSALQKPSSLISSGRFISLIKYWLGRCISTCINFSQSLTRIVFKTEKAALPVFQQKELNTQEEIVETQNSPISQMNSTKILSLPTPNVALEIVSEQSSTPKSFSPQIQSEEINHQELPIINQSCIDSLPLIDLDSTPILKNLFQNFDLENSFEEIFSNAMIVDLETKEVIKDEDKSISFNELTGHFQVEWICKLDKELIILIYKGKLQQGQFHGEGHFMTENSKKHLHSLLKGQFKHNHFISGLMVTDDCLIDGTFAHDQKSGQGIIFSYLYTEEGFPMYQGFFKNETPHGYGTKFIMGKAELKIKQDGLFKDGKLIQGLETRKEGQIYEGLFNIDEHVFQGTITGKTSEKEYTYSGRCKDNQFDDQGSYEFKVTRPLKKLTVNEAGKKTFIKVKDDIFVFQTGIFEKNSFFKGEQIILHPDFIERSEFEDKNVVCCEIKHRSNGYIYKGNFKEYTLDGDGTIYGNEDDDQEIIYKGEIKAGYPHGEGAGTYGDGIYKEGRFAFGQYLGPYFDLDSDTDSSSNSDSTSPSTPNSSPESYF